MNLYDFFSCNHDERADLVYSQGELVVVRGSGAYRIYLYTLNRFFAEVWCRSDNNEVDLVRGFKSVDMLEPYLELIDISELTEK